MKTFDEIFSGSLPVYHDLARRGFIKLVRREDGGVCFDRDWEAYKLSPYCSREMTDYLNGSTGSASMFVHCEAFARGPKIISAAHLDYGALESTDLNIQFKDYNQPFQTVIVELPYEYARSREMPVLDSYRQSYNKLGIISQQPRYVIIYHNKEFDALLVSVVFDSKYIYTTSMVNMGNEWELKAGFIDVISVRHTWDDSFEALPGEDVPSINAITVALNIVLLVDEFGLRCRGPLDQSRYDRLTKYRDNAQKSGDRERKQKAIDDIRKIPIVYEFEQEVHLYDHARVNESGETGEGGREVQSHWRRGHYRMQHYGLKNALVKRIRIKPVLVNAHLFLGNTGNTKVVYRP